MSDQKLARAYDDAMEQIVNLEAEIERLRADLKMAIMSDSEECKLLTADNERLRGQISDILAHDGCACDSLFEAGKLRDEIERLRALLRAMYEDAANDYDTPIGEWRLAINAALERK